MSYSSRYITYIQLLLAGMQRLYWSI